MNETETENSRVFSIRTDATGKTWCQPVRQSIWFVNSLTICLIAAAKVNTCV